VHFENWKIKGGEYLSTSLSKGLYRDPHCINCDIFTGHRKGLALLGVGGAILHHCHTYMLLLSDTLPSSLFTPNIKCWHHAIDITVKLRLMCLPAMSPTGIFRMLRFDNIQMPFPKSDLSRLVKKKD